MGHLPDPAIKRLEQLPQVPNEPQVTANQVTANQPVLLLAELWPSHGSHPLPSSLGQQLAAVETQAPGSGVAHGRRLRRFPSLAIWSGSSAICEICGSSVLTDECADVAACAIECSVSGSLHYQPNLRFAVG